MPNTTVRPIDANKLKQVVNDDITRCYALGIGNVGQLSLFLDQIDEQPTVEIDTKFTETDFTEDELMLLKMAFKLVDDVVEMQRCDNYDTYMCNELFHLKVKLGIDDIV